LRHEERICTQVSPLITTDFRQEDLGYFTQAEREPVDKAADLERRSISSFVANAAIVCADFLAGANLENGNPQILLHSIMRFFEFLPAQERQRFLERVLPQAS
jgi:hypothetical protein